MNISESMIENIFKLLIARLPPDAAEKAGELIRAGVELKLQLDRMEMRLAGMEYALKYLVEQERARDGRKLQRTVDGPGSGDGDASASPQAYLGMGT